MIIVMIRWTGLAPWEFELPFPGSITSTFLVQCIFVNKRVPGGRDAGLPAGGRREASPRGKPCLASPRGEGEAGADLVDEVNPKPYIILPKS